MSVADRVRGVALLIGLLLVPVGMWSASWLVVLPSYGDSAVVDLWTIAPGLSNAGRVVTAVAGVVTIVSALALVWSLASRRGPVRWLALWTAAIAAIASVSGIATCMFGDHPGGTYWGDGPVVFLVGTIAVGGTAVLVFRRRLDPDGASETDSQDLAWIGTAALGAAIVAVWRARQACVLFPRSEDGEQPSWSVGTWIAIALAGFVAMCACDALRSIPLARSRLAPVLLLPPRRELLGPRARRMTLTALCVTAIALTQTAWLGSHDGFLTFAGFFTAMFVLAGLGTVAIGIREYEWLGLGVPTATALWRVVDLARDVSRTPLSETILTGRVPPPLGGALKLEVVVLGAVLGLVLLGARSNRTRVLAIATWIASAAAIWKVSGWYESLEKRELWPELGVSYPGVAAALGVASALLVAGLARLVLTSSRRLDLAVAPAASFLAILASALLESGRIWFVPAGAAFALLVACELRARRSTPTRVRDEGEYVAWGPQTMAKTRTAFSPWGRGLLVATLVVAAGWLTLALRRRDEDFLVGYDPSTHSHMSASACALSAIVVAALAGCALGLRTFERTLVVIASTGVIALIAVVDHAGETTDTLHAILAVIACVVMIPLGAILAPRSDA